MFVIQITFLLEQAKNNLNKVVDTYKSYLYIDIMYQHY